ncbi:hypothetical protein F4810DRAFT_673990 [Camillea tinctor]|nr:hypothetical protein F4810DRAFT_673990 [Camillea tinctor]
MNVREPNFIAIRRVNNQATHGIRYFTLGCSPRVFSNGSYVLDMSSPAMALYTYPDGTITALPPPNDYNVDFENPQRQFVEALDWTSGVLSIVTLLFVCQRLYVTFVVEKRVFLDDGFLFIAWVLLLTITAITIHMAAIGTLGTHAWELPFDAFTTFFRQSFPLFIIYALCTLFAKMALLVYYVRLIPRSWYYVVNISTMLVVLGSSVGIILATLFSCRPIARAWDATINNYRCIDQSAITAASDIIGLIVDLALLVIPITIVRHVNMHWKQRTGLAILFFIGLWTIAVAVVHLYVDIDMENEADMTWVAARRLYWRIIEANMLVICATFPSLARFLRHVMPKFTSHIPVVRLAGDSEDDSSFLVFRGFGDPSQKTPIAQYNRFVSTDYALDSFSQIDSERAVSRGSTTDKTKTDVSWKITPIEHEAAASREDIIQHLRSAYR